jgi:DNA-directed RNA polymerase subunit RPC12/RpoP
VDRPEFIRRIDFDEVQFEQLVHTAIAAVKGGDREQARRLLFKAVEMKPGDAEPWLWLSATTDDPAEQRDYLEHAVAADPANAAARRGLALLSGKVDTARLLDEGEGVLPRQPTGPEEASAEQVFLCPQCGGHLKFDIQQQDLICEFCGHRVKTAEIPADESSEQVLDFILPTTRGHRWAEAQHRLACEQCGALVLLPVGQTADECPHCGSRRLIESAETGELVEPQAILLAQFDAQAAHQHLKAWLGRGWFAPDDLRKLAQTSALRPAYYPFWAFDGTLELSWSCEVNQGGSRGGDWRMSDGVELEMFTDVLVPGWRLFERMDLGKAGEFDLSKAVLFKPEYLAGWSALTYDIPLADASLKARQTVTRRLRQQLPNRVLIGAQKRNLRSGSTRWSGVTFTHVLLPLWVGSYRYRNRLFRVVINGQSGSVAGLKPGDAWKVFGISASAFATLFLIAFLLLYLALSMGWIKP